MVGLNSCNTSEPCRFNKKTIDMPVPSSSWKFDKDNKQFYVHFDIKDITADVYNYGNFSLHREYNFGTNDAYMVALPLSVYNTDTLEELSVVYYTQYIDYRLGVGFLDIQLTNSDYMYGAENPETMFFRLQAGTVTLDLTINQADWQFDEGTSQYYHRFELPELTSEIYDFANWTVCREFNKGTTDAYQVQLPSSMYMTDTITTNPLVYYTQHIDYRVGIGYVEVQVTNSDHLYFEDAAGNIINPEDMRFHMQLMW